MRFPSFPTILRTFQFISNATTNSYPAAQRGIYSSYRALPLKSMPTIPFLSSLFHSSKESRKMSHAVEKTDDEWRAILTPEQFRVIRTGGTEAPGTGKYNKHMPERGTYNCAACNAALYTAETKFDSGCGWPAFYDTIPGAVTRHTDTSFGMSRTEIVCTNCGGHLGHVFKGEGFKDRTGKKTSTDERHCVNSVSLNFANEPKA
ncbi:putative methionine-R-sulfoxide reductase SelR [Patellaria atrata CBS 101060]|uniref:Peptide-methionine (R)-S-oxide reductase n=1 Tax=Patellaria atrata CBS 101060 TaxID=1346257 RepID=A0A9P4S803_9PEZI|nr:putative methionine-R-sulfoxide reductase SelR [Patellaria atrata CBS 101060]